MSSTVGDTVDNTVDDTAARPCYFNTGCRYSDGDVTGLELADGEIRRVRWPDRTHHAKPLILARAPIGEVFRRLAP